MRGFVHAATIPCGFRLRAVAFVRAGKPIRTAAVQLGVSAAALHGWVRQDQIDRGERPGTTSPETAELAKAKKRVRQLESAVEILKVAARLLGEDRPGSKGFTWVVDHLLGAGYRVKLCCRLLGVSSPGYYRYKNRPISPTRMRRLWLTGLIGEVHVASRQTSGSRRVHAELTIGRKLQVSERLVAVLMSRAGIRGLPGAAKMKRLHGIATADDLVHRKIHRLSPNELWITDITEHPTTAGIQARDGRISCCAVMDTFSRKIVGWCRSTTPTTPPWSSTHWIWQSRTGNRPPAESSMPTTECNSPRGHSPTRSARLG